ncbi:MAG: NAD(P)/FAD-dependent oxidoreductase [Clostridia bacterium]|nr:NAD(P)/FAD-dependent oxidoreductase [Clostridia bacterium]
MRVYVIGGGAAGMMSAICARRSGFDVTILERNEKTGKKLFITGKGRCNLTNNSSVQNLIDNTVRNGKFLFGVFRNFDSGKCMDFFEELGVPLKTERGNRVFPVSDKSSDVIAALNKELKRLNVEIKLHQRVVGFGIKDNTVAEIKTENAVYTDVGYVILATGGVTYPATGSTGDGYKLAASVGHTIVEPVPSLCDVRLKEPTVDMRGLSLKNVACSIEQDGKRLFSEFGEMLFTDNGVGGPCVLSLSAKICKKSFSGMRFVIDLKPALDEETLKARIQRDLDGQSNKAVKNVLPALLPKSLIPTVLTKAEISGDKQCNAVTKAERGRLAFALKNLSFTVLGCEMERAVITAGGVKTDEVSPKTMRSKLIDNLAFAGEILDVDAMTGGYNLQIAFATGFAAGNNAEIE